MLIMKMTRRETTEEIEILNQVIQRISKGVLLSKRSLELGWGELY